MMTNKLRILHLAGFTGKRSFGVGPVALGLASSQQALGHQVSICSLDSEGEARELERAYHLHPGTIHTFPIVGPSRVGFSPQMAQHIIAHAAEYDVVHAHGIWTYTSRVVNRWRARRGGPTIVAPHGSLDAWVLRRSRWKKRLAMMLYERENLHQAPCLHALSMREVEGFRAFGLGNPVAVIPNGISEDWIASAGDAERFRFKFELARDTRVMLFLGRITPKKGLPMFLQAMADVRQYLEGWKLVIAGVNEFGHQQKVQACIEQLALQPFVQFVGPLYGQDKRDAFAAADIFILPSYSENFAVVVTEALGAGVPVIATRSTPWEELVTHRCGWLTEISEQAIARALQEAMQKPRAELQQMGERGKSLIAEKYTMTKIAEQTILLYDWLLGRGAKPEFVFQD